MRRAYISGFTGSAGTAVVTKDKAALWTDGRYFLQVWEKRTINLLFRHSAELAIYIMVSKLYLFLFYFWEVCQIFVVSIYFSLINILISCSLRDINFIGNFLSWL